MKKMCASFLCGAVALSIYLLGSHEAQAVPAFKTEFDNLYVTKGTPFAEVVAETKCNVCHVGKSKKDRNAYGEALHEFLNKKDAKNKEKIVDSLKKVETKHSKADDEKSPTFGDLIKAGKLPQ